MIKADDNGKREKRGLSRHANLLAVAGLLVILFAVFFKSFVPGWTLASGDGSLSAVQYHYRLLPYGYVARWHAASNLGSRLSTIFMTPGFLLAHIVPYTKYADANYVFHLALLGIFSFFLLLDLTRHRFASFLGSAWLMLQPHVFSHMLPGHIGHFQMIGWIPGSFLFLRKAVKSGRVAHWVLAGGLFGIAINSGTLDVALFFGLHLAAYGVFLLFVPLARSSAEGQVRREGGRRWLRMAGGIAAAALACFLTGYQATANGLIINKVVGKSGDSSAISATTEDLGDAEREWDWATQWSVPIEETLDALVPGLFGWGSSNRENPYRGRVGQSPTFDQNRAQFPDNQRMWGMPNLNDVSDYLGAVIMLTVFLALWLRRRNPDVWFFTSAAVIALLLSFGRHAPFYRLFYELPLVHTFRNPIKWFYITSFSVGIVGAYGLAAVLSPTPSSAEKPQPGRLAAVLFVPGVLVILASAILLSVWPAREAAWFWRLSPKFVLLSWRAVGIAAFFWFAAATVLLVATLSRSKARERGSVRTLVPKVMLAGLLLGELIYVDAHYLPYTRSRQVIQGGAVAQFLNSQDQPFRITLLSNEGVFGYIASVLVSHYGWETDRLASGRTMDEASLFGQALAADPIRRLQLCNVRFVLAPGRIDDPRFKPVMNMQAGQTRVVIYAFTEALPRYYLVPSWKTVPMKDRFSAISEPTFNPRSEVLIHEPPASVPEPPRVPATTLDCVIEHYSWHEIRLHTTTDAPTMLVGLDRFDPAWHVYLDGKEIPMWRADGIVRACLVPEGQHRIELKLIGEGAWPLVLTLAGWVCLGLCAVWAARHGSVSPETSSEAPRP